VVDFKKDAIKNVSLSMFRKDFIGVFHGSISAKTEDNRFIINKKDTIFDEITEEELVELHYNVDYRWSDASMDAYIHLNIYKNIPEAKYICYTMPPYATAYSLTQDIIMPRDYFGKKLFKSIEVYNPKTLDDWYDRAEIEIYRNLVAKKTSIMIIKGYGVYTFDRDIYKMAKKVAILENSCKLLYLSSLPIGSRTVL
jgi:L-fuculose-phosphate aldolase